jgi:hypothetical protein
MRIECDRCGKVRMVNDGCGGLAGGVSPSLSPLQRRERGRLATDQYFIKCGPDSA